MSLLCRQKLFNIGYKKYPELRRFASEITTGEVLTQYFGLPSYKVMSYIKSQKLARIKPENLIQTAKFCEEIGFETKSVLDAPMLLRLYPSTVDQYYTVLREGGFENITPNVLAKFRTLCRAPIHKLKSRFIDPQTNVVESFISYLNPRPDNLNVKTCGDEEAWSEVHLKVLSAYLKWRLKATDDDIAKLIKVHPTVCRKSFRYLCENIATAEELGFTPDKILKYGYIVHAYPKHTKELMEKYPIIAGACIKRAMRMYPKIVTTPPTNIEKILKILKEHNISDEALAKRMNVLHLSPETVDVRLNELKNIADFKVLLHNPNILKLVIHHNRAKSRLQFLKELQIKCTTVSVLGNDNTKFDIHIREGRDANTFSDIYAFLKGTFKKETDEFEGTLKKHPYYLQVPLLSMEETYFYLREEKFSNSAIFKVIYILLYPKEKIRNAFKEVKQFASRRKKPLSQVNRLNLVLYFIEREHHFTGDGVWEKNERLEETV
ncbi:transcription termination factor 5, mitochondrial [Tribolium madens]|uniref:transcription termination factor 5, mitochondrial n=1 Tax=Tribolium madens TaxID=41895 RepID=UPI001CF73891|nr:transcription termination factor 5, mitochondrial [Tribolium madens]